MLVEGTDIQIILHDTRVHPPFGTCQFKMGISDQFIVGQRKREMLGSRVNLLLMVAIGRIAEGLVQGKIGL